MANDTLLATAGIANGIQNVLIPYLQNRWQTQNQMRLSQNQNQNLLERQKNFATFEAGLRPKSRRIMIDESGKTIQDITGDPGQDIQVTKIEKPNIGGSSEDRSYLASRYDRSAGVFNAVKEGYNRVAASMRGTAAGDMSLIFGIMKMLDPNSTVREGEYATAQNAGSIPDRVRAQYNKAIKGDFLSPSQRKDFVTQSQGLWTNAKREHQSTNTRFQSEAAKMGVDPGSFIIPADSTAESDVSKFLTVPAGTSDTIGKPKLRFANPSSATGTGSLLDDLLKEHTSR